MSTAAATAGAWATPDAELMAVQKLASGDVAGAKVLADAAEIVRWHRPDTGGFCLGCLRQWDRHEWFPCSQGRWARMVLDRQSDLETGRDPGEGR